MLDNLPILGNKSSTDRKVIFVLGMGRSGTSAMTRVLALCGAFIPGSLLGPNESNPTGHWEPIEALELNDTFLSRYGATWFDPTFRLQCETTFGHDDQQAFVKQICSFLGAASSSHSLLLVKEPRITALSEFWFEAARLLGLQIRVVIPVRHPNEVAASLATRDGISFELASALWLKYSLLAERQSRNFLRVFVEYSNFLADWRREMARISSALDIGLFPSDEAAVNSFLRNDLRHQRHTGAQREVFVEPWLGRVYQALSSTAHGLPCDEFAMDAVFSAYSGCERAFRISLDESRNKVH